MFRSGLLTARDAAALDGAVELAERTHRTLMRLELAFRDEFPARLTAWDAATQRASWTEESWDRNGQRYIRPAGRTGTPTFMPAVPVGNGLMPPDAFPVQVWLRRRDVATEAATGTYIGPVYEFDWVCACAGSGSGSGSGSGGGQLTGCCPGAIPPTLTATFDVTSGSYAGMDGQSMTLTYSGGQWVGSATFTGILWTVRLSCDGTTWKSHIFSDDNNCIPEASPIEDVTRLSCSPLHLLSATYIIPPSCPTGGSSGFQATFTE